MEKSLRWYCRPRLGERWRVDEPKGIRWYDPLQRLAHSSSLLNHHFKYGLFVALRYIVIANGALEIDNDSDYSSTVGKNLTRNFR
jgi:hypothetical protein